MNKKRILKYLLYLLLTTAFVVLMMQDDDISTATRADTITSIKSQLDIMASICFGYIIGYWRLLH